MLVGREWSWVGMGFRWVTRGVRWVVRDRGLLGRVSFFHCQICDFGGVVSLDPPLTLFFVRLLIFFYILKLNSMGSF